ncbi:hypothetical protein FE391_00720 [Nonomuraea sp. KC401]|uniref:hypothetical protein n=1 Tax=unclassified Nonomuraea TaxID=2593643 RepID=UPI0010FDD54B|nr:MULTISPECIES: hypothetical protein [unclassified Nonomuraea]NBE91859.1 hypothetical protein [Nonomuraea sp. K271]TLF86452.1 hypothetical protein FE391_00720 [Nonomuraea sp. KC401]
MRLRWSRDGERIMMAGRRTLAGAVVKTAIIVVNILVLATGCGLWPHKTIRAEAGAVDEVRSIGRVAAQTTEDPLYGDTVQVDDILIMDVEASSFEEGVSAAREQLEQRGWVTTFKGVAFTEMRSNRWKGASLTIRPFELDKSYKFAVQNRIAEVVNVDPNGRIKYLLVMITRVPEPKSTV